jgi:adenylate kinase
MVNTFLFVGRPGSGKGVQSALLSEKTGLPIFSTGNRVREISKKPHNLGRKVKAVQESGGLTPHWFASFLFQEALFAQEGEGIIFEGVGRKEPEARLFDEIHRWLESDYLVFNLNVSDETVMKRLIARGEKEGRADDVPEKIAVRLEEFFNQTMPAIEFFRSAGRLVEIDGEAAPEEVSEAVMAQIKRYEAQK